MKHLALIIALALPVSATAHHSGTRDLPSPGVPERQDALVVTCGFAAFALVATGAVTGPNAGALVPILPFLCQVWDELGRPKRSPE